jgi:hypothetical protein
MATLIGTFSLPNRIGDILFPLRKGAPEVPHQDTIRSTTLFDLWHGFVREGYVLGYPGNSLGKLLKRERETQKYNLDEFSKLIGYDPTEVALVENHIHNPTLDFIDAYMLALNPPWWNDGSKDVEPEGTQDQQSGVV